MEIWQFQEAKAKLTLLLKQAKKSPQVISKHGVNDSVVLSISDYEKLFSNNHNDIVSFLRSSPLYDVGDDLEIERDKSKTRDEIDL